MTTVSFTHRIDSRLKTALEEIARYDQRSASFVANQAIQAFVEERQATRELVETGLALVEAGAPSISADDLHNWLLSEDENKPFPEGRTVS